MGGWLDAVAAAPLPFPSPTDGPLLANLGTDRCEVKSHGVGCVIV